MTIKIERDAILCAIDNTCSSAQSKGSYVPRQDEIRYSPQKLRQQDEDDFFRLSSSHDHHDDSLSQPELDDTDDDDSTLSSCSSCSNSSKGVTFSDDLVTEVRWRPRTLRKHIASLFYTVEETQRFRQEYREERRLKAQGDSNASSTLSNSGKSNRDGFQNQGLALDNCSSTRNHRISRVVVLHKDTRETFVDGELSVSHSSSGCGNLRSDSTTTSFNPQTEKCKEASGAFFDNDSFWSGQITWF